MGKQSQLIDHMAKEIRRNTDCAEEAEFVLERLGEMVKNEMRDTFEVKKLTEHPKYGSCCYGKNPDCMADEYCQDCESRVVCLEKYHVNTDDTSDFEVGYPLTEEEKRDRYATAVSEANEERG